MIETGAPVASFAQAPNPALVARCKEAGLFVMPTVGARRHAEKVAEWGVDAVIAQGAEGGGHTGSVPTTLLLPQVVDAVGDQVLVLGAGGFFSGRGLVAALAYGAAGVAMGTRFLLSAESRVPDAVKGLYLATPSPGPSSPPRSTGPRSASSGPTSWTTSSPSRGCAPCPARCAVPSLPPGDRCHHDVAAARGTRHEGRQRAHVGPGAHGSQRTGDDQGRARRRAYRRRRAADRSGGRRVGVAALGRRHRRRHHARSRRDSQGWAKPESDRPL